MMMTIGVFLLLVSMAHGEICTSTDIFGSSELLSCGKCCGFSDLTRFCCPSNILNKISGAFSGIGDSISDGLDAIGGSSGSDVMSRISSRRGTSRSFSRDAVEKTAGGTIRTHREMSRSQSVSKSVTTRKGRNSLNTAEIIGITVGIIVFIGIVVGVGVGVVYYNKSSSQEDQAVSNNQVQPTVSVVSTDQTNHAAFPSMPPPAPGVAFHPQTRPMYPPPVNTQYGRANR